MVEFVGFDGQEPFSIIIWQLNEEDMSKTVCYSKQDEKDALNRFFTQGDFYNKYDRALVIQSDDEVLEYKKLKRGA